MHVLVAAERWKCSPPWLVLIGKGRMAADGAALRAILRAQEAHFVSVLRPEIHVVYFGFRNLRASHFHGNLLRNYRHYRLRSLGRLARSSQRFVQASQDLPLANFEAESSRGPSRSVRLFSCTFTTATRFVKRESFAVLRQFDACLQSPSDVISPRVQASSCARYSGRSVTPSSRAEATASRTFRSHTASSRASVTRPELCRRKLATSSDSQRSK